MNNKKFEYYTATIRNTEHVLQIHTLAEFARLAAGSQIKHILKTIDQNQPSFALAAAGVIYTCPSAGFESLEDFLDAEENHFPDAAAFYDARKNNCHTFAQYQMLLSTGIAGTAVVEEIKKLGYLDGFPVFDQQRKDTPSLPQLTEITNVKELYDYATAKKFTGFAQFHKLWQAGFTDPIEYERASEKGLKTAGDYHTFITGKFETADEFKTAKSHEITTRHELQLFLGLHEAEYNIETTDQLLLLHIITHLEPGDKTPLTKLFNFFVKTEEQYKLEPPGGGKKLPKWYVKRMKTEADVKEFLTKSDEVKKFGTLNAGNDIFETIPINRRKVVVDGSNVAYNSNMADRRAGVFNARFNNILILVNKLKDEYGFDDIHVISDNNLIHKASDKEVLKKIKTLCKYSETPPGTPADLYLINHVKKHHCLLVTNDTFKDWKLTDPWLEDNIDFYRIKFMLNDDKVVLPHMERFDKK